MASELSRLIEDELQRKGYSVNNDEEKEADEEAPHQALMGALRVEVRRDQRDLACSGLRFRCPTCATDALVILLISPGSR